MKKNLKVLFLFFCMAIFFSACAGDTNSPNATLPSSSQSTQEENPLSPGNLPPPGSEEEVAGATAENSNLFFQRKELWDSFSDELKARVTATYQDPSLKGAGPGGMGYYNTLFGRVSPIKANTSVPAPSAPKNVLKNGGQFLLMSQTVGSEAVLYCPSFLCLDSPQDKLNTVFDSVIVAGRIRMGEAALFGPEDPVMMISVFRQSGQAVAQDIPIYGKEVASSMVLKPDSGSNTESQPAEAPQSVEIGVFSKTVPLMGAGEYTVIITAFQNLGDSVSLQPIYVTIYRQDNPTIEILDLKPPATGNQYFQAPSPGSPDQRQAAVHTGDIVSMPSVIARVKVNNASSIESVNENVGIIFENYDEAGNLRYVSKGESNFTPFSTDPNHPDNTPVKKAVLPLFNGLNKFVVLGHNQQMDDFSKLVGLPPPPMSQEEFILTNILPAVQIKMISPQDGSLVEPNSNLVSVKFCLTGLPDLPGRDISISGEGCVLSWNGDKPKVLFNGYELESEALTVDASTGVYSFNAKAFLGANIVSIAVTNKNYLPPADPASQSLDNIGSYKFSFQYGKVNKLFKNGALKEKDNFLSRGLSIEINKKLVSTDVKKILMKYLNEESFKQSLRDLFAKKDSGSPVVCTETGALSISDGDTTIDFLPEGFNIGNIVINQIEPKNDGRFYLDVTIHGFHGEANLRGFNAPVQVQIGGKDASFVPLSIWVKELRAKIALRLGKENGLMKVMIERQSTDEKAVTLVGDGPMGNVAHVNSTRNPLAAGLEAYDAQTGLLSKSFGESLESTILCGVEAGMNHKENGLIKWSADLEKLVSYNNLNPFRIPLEFELLNKLVGLDIAYDLLRANIQFSGRGITIRDIPLRITPSPRILNALPDALKNTLMGSLSMPLQNPELTAALPATDENMNFALSLSEDAINQALYAASVAGMLDLDIDPNFYTKNDIGFVSLAAPTLQGMLGVKVDLNQNGVDDDDNLPILTRLRASRIEAPTLHFLTSSEVASLQAQLEKEYSRDVNSGDSNAKKENLASNIKYFRLSIPNLELSFYQLRSFENEPGSGKYFCFNKPIDDPELASKPELPDVYGVNATRKACGQKISHTTDPDSAGACPAGYTRLFIPTKNGEIISADPTKPEVPVVKFKATITFYGVIQGVFREVLTSDKYKVDLSSSDTNHLVIQENYKPTNFVRIKILQRALKSLGPQAQFYAVENRTPFSSDVLSDKLGKILITSALGDECENLNEIRIPIPDRIPDAGADSSTGLTKALKDFGVDYLDLGTTEDKHPLLGLQTNTANLPVNDSLYLDLLAQLGVCYMGENCNL